MAHTTNLTHYLISLEYRIKGDKVSFLSEDYGEYLDKGVKGAKSTYPESSASPFKYTTKRPPAEVFEKWIKKSNIQGRDKKTGRFMYTTKFKLYNSK